MYFSGQSSHITATLALLPHWTAVGCWNSKEFQSPIRWRQRTTVWKARMQVNRPHTCRLPVFASFQGHSVFRILCQGRAGKRRTNRKRNATVRAAGPKSTGESMSRNTTSKNTTSARNNFMHKVRLTVLLSARSQGRALKLPQTALQLLLKFVLGHNPQHTCQKAAVG